MTRRYRAFISYSWADKAWAGWLHRSLELYRTPRPLVGRETPLGPVPSGLHPIFKDREEEAAGHGVGAAIEAALAASDFLIVICSPRSAKSQWVNREVAWFKTHKEKSRILALIVDGEPGHETENCFPRALTHKIGPDLQPTEESEDPPLAADARAAGDGKRGAKLKLAAALLGVGLDDLVRRDERRRTTRRRLVTGAAFSLAAILGGLSIFAFNQRDAAVAARNDAVKARDDAEGLIELVLTDLKSDLEGYGTLKSVTAIGNRAIGYYEGQDVKALTPDQLGRRARVLLMLGEADNKRGDLDAALARYEEAAATTGEQLRRDPENPQRIFDHAQSVFWVGYIAWQRGDRKAAKRQFTEYHDLSQKLVAKDPANEDWQAELDYAYSNLGTLAMEQGDAREAEALFRAALEVSRRLSQTAPGDATRILALGNAYSWLADAIYFQGRIREAQQFREHEAAIYANALRAAPENSEFKRSAALSHVALAVLADGANDPSSMINHAATSLQLVEELRATDPENLVWADQAAFARVLLGEGFIRRKNLSEAKSALAQAAAESASLVDRDPGVARWRGVTHAQARLALAELHTMSGEPAAARLLYEELRQDLRALVDGPSPNPLFLRRYCSALAGLAAVDRNPEPLWSEVITRLEGDLKRQGPEGRALLATAYLATAAPDKARALATPLYDAGYRQADFLLRHAPSPI